MRCGNRAPRYAWPTSHDSAQAIGERLVRPRKLFQAGAVGVVGLILGLILYLVGAPSADGAVESVFDLPFAGCSVERLLPLAMAAVILLGFAAMIGGVYGAIQLGRWVSQPIIEMRDPTTLTGVRGAWLRCTNWISHNRVTFWLLRWIGGSRRNAWSLLATIGAWAPLIALWIAILWTLIHFECFARVGDGFGALHVIVALLGLALFALGASLGGEGFAVRAKHLHPGGRSFGSYVASGVIRSLFGVLGLVTALLAMWTPYAWTRLAAVSHVGWIAVAFGYSALRWVFGAIGVSLSPQVWRRRLSVLVAFAVIAALYVAVPMVVLHRACSTPSSPWWAALGAVFGGYLTCLWIGWYFLICLQFDGHGNEAGGAARIVRFAQFIRIRLTATRADVWVIAAEDVKTDRAQGYADRPPIARLVDHFTVGAPPA